MSRQMLTFEWFDKLAKPHRDVSVEDIRRLIETYSDIPWREVAIRVYPYEKKFHYYDVDGKLLGGGDLDFLIERLKQLRDQK